MIPPLNRSQSAPFFIQQNGPIHAGHHTSNRDSLCFAAAPQKSICQRLKDWLQATWTSICNALKNSRSKSTKDQELIALDARIRAEEAALPVARAEYDGAIRDCEAAAAAERDAAEQLRLAREAARRPQLNLRELLGMEEPAFQAHLAAQAAQDDAMEVAFNRFTQADDARNAAHRRSMQAGQNYSEIVSRLHDARMQRMAVYLN